MSVELFITNLDFLTKLQANFNLDDFILNFNATQINVQGGIFFSKSINVQTKIRPCRREFLLKINKCACTSIRYTRVFELATYLGLLEHCLILFTTGTILHSFLWTSLQTSFWPTSQTSLGTFVQT